MDYGRRISARPIPGDRGAAVNRRRKILLWFAVLAPLGFLALCAVTMQLLGMYMLYSEMGHW